MYTKPCYTSRFRSHLKRKAKRSTIKDKIFFWCERKNIRFFYANKRRRTIARQRDNTRINGDIPYPKVRLVDETGEMVGVIPIEEALDKAAAADLDLVLVNDHPKNPVCKIMDYGKYSYEQSKRAREAKKNQKTTQVKEVQIKLTTEEHDFNVKVRNARRFLENEDRVKVVIRFRGREMNYQDQGLDVMEDFAHAVEDLGKVDRPPRMEGRHMVMFLAPLKDKDKN